jgi:hypothetical protein
MKSKDIIKTVGFVCLLVLAFSISKTLMAGDKDSYDLKRMDGIWVAPGAYITCSSADNSSARWFTCTSHSFSSVLGMFGPMVYQGFFTGPDTYRMTSIGYFKFEGQELGLVVVKRYAGRLLDDNTLDHYAYAMLYADADDNCLPSSGDILLTADPNLVHEQASRLEAIFPENIPFPDYPPEP